jgi:hypothetical protein
MITLTKKDKRNANNTKLFLKRKGDKFIKKKEKKEKKRRTPFEEKGW